MCGILVSMRVLCCACGMGKFCSAEGVIAVTEKSCIFVGE